jgi:hypothetical protein
MRGRVICIVIFCGICLALSYAFDRMQTESAGDQIYWVNKLIKSNNQDRFSLVNKSYPLLPQARQSPGGSVFTLSDRGLILLHWAVDLERPAQMKVRLLEESLRYHYHAIMLAPTDPLPWLYFSNAAEQYGWGATAEYAEEMNAKYSGEKESSSRSGLPE